MSRDEFDDESGVDPAVEPTDLDPLILLSDGVESMVRGGAAGAVALLLAVGATIQIIVDSVVVNTLRFLLSEIRATENVENRQQAIDQLTTLIENTTATSLTVDLPTSALFGLLVLVLVVGEIGSIVAIRLFAGDGTPTMDVVTRRLPVATLHGLVAGFLLGIAVFLGTIALVVPGLFVLVATVFVRQEIALDDKGPFEAVSGAWDRAKGNRWLLAGFVIGLLILGQITSTLAAFVAPLGDATSVVTAVVSTLFTVYAMAIVTEAYQRLRRRGQETSADAGSDDEWVEDDEWT